MQWIYLDNAATTPPLDEVLEVMTLTAKTHFANPSSPHTLGTEARRFLNELRSRMAAVLACRSEEVVFTAGGSEADALALFGAAYATRKRTLVVSAIEHSAVFNAARELERRGFRLKVCPADTNVMVTERNLLPLIDDDTFLVSVMWANNEVGTIEPVRALARAVKREHPDVLFHSDAVQALGKVKIDLRDGVLDLVSFGAHKLHGPRWCGALYVRKGVRLSPLVYGGGQESGLRSGTENVAAVAGFVVAAEHAVNNLGAHVAHMSELRELLRRELTAGVPGLRVLGHDSECLPNVLAVAVEGVQAQNLVTFLEEQGVLVSAGSACHSKSTKPSRVVETIQLPPHFGVVRLSVSPLTTADDCRLAAGKFVEAVHRLKSV